MDNIGKGIGGSTIKYRDFLPKLLVSSSLFNRAKYDSLDSITSDVNDWVQSHPSVHLLNIETLIIPNIDQSSLGSGDGIFHVSQRDGKVTKWIQLIRVWYVGDPEEGGDEL